MKKDLICEERFNLFFNMHLSFRKIWHLLNVEELDVACGVDDALALMHRSVCIAIVIEWIH